MQRALATGICVAVKLPTVPDWASDLPHLSHALVFTSRATNRNCMGPGWQKPNCVEVRDVTAVRIQAMEETCAFTSSL